MAQRRARLVLAALVVASLGAAGISAAASPVLAAPKTASAKTAAAAQPQAAPSKVNPLVADRPVHDLAASALGPGPVKLPAAGTSAVLAPVKGVARAGASVVSVGQVRDGTGALTAADGSVQTLAQPQTRAMGGVAAFRVGLPAGARSARVRVDGKGFASAYGGGYAGRMGLFAVPDCFTARPDDAACRPKVLPTTRNVTAGTLEATVSLTPVSVRAPIAVPTRAGATAAKSLAAPAAVSGAAVTLLAAATATGDAGSYTATPLSPAGSWVHGGSSGSFTYNYPLRVPVAINGDAPKLSLSYDSGSVDGRTTAENGQVSWLGQGWDMEDSFIERKYGGCATESDASSKGMSGWGDLCWTNKAQYVLSMDGASHDLIPVTDTPLATEFRLRDDPGWQVLRRIGRSNGDGGEPGTSGDQGEFWVITTPDGTDYYFGWGVTGWATTEAVDTKSVWTVPVFGDDPSEPCNTTTTAASWCQQAWRWNLDRVVDRHSNVMSYIYVPEENNYARNASSTKGTTYTRGGRLSRIEYGGKSAGTAAGGTSYTSVVDLHAVRRCTAELAYPFSGAGNTCPAVNPTNASAYPDIPTDLICTVGATSCNTTTQASPTFFVTYRLDTVTMSNVVGGVTKPLDSYEFKALLPDPDGTGPETADLWLQQFRHNGLNGASTVTLPTFQIWSLPATLLPNRVDTAGGTVMSLLKYRIAGMITETGNRIDVTYGHASTAQTCTQSIVDGGDGTGPLVYDANTNTRECFPRWWKPPTGSAGFAWFHKYVLKQVNETDPTIGAVLNPSPPAKLQTEPRVTTFEYIGNGAWHHDDNVLARTGLNGATSTESWSQWRGYQTVITHHVRVSDGTPDPVDRDQIKNTYYRGMDKDKKDDAGNLKSFTIDTAETVPVADQNPLAGFLAETLTIDENGLVQSRDWFSPWLFKTIEGPETSGADYITSRDAFILRTDDVRHRLRKNTDPNAIQTRTVTSYYGDPLSPRTLLDGMVYTVDDQGDQSVTNDSRCTLNAYVWNNSNENAWNEPAAHIRLARTTTRSNDCVNGTLLSQTEYIYDGTPRDTASTSFVLGSTPTLSFGDVTTTRSFYAVSKAIYTGAQYDGYGRVTASYDGNGNRTGTSYTPYPGFPTSMSVGTPNVPLPGGIAAPLTTTTTLDARGSAVAVTDPNAQKTTFVYDALGRLLSFKKPGQQGASLPDTAFFTYTDSNTGNNPNKIRSRVLQAGTDAATAKYDDTHTYYDGYGRPVQTQVSPGILTFRTVTVTRYGDRGLLSGQSISANDEPGTAGDNWINLDRDSLKSETRYSYDALKRKLADITMTVGGVEQYRTTTVWNGNNRRVTPPTGGDLEYLVDARGRTTAAKEYDTAGVAYSTTTLDYDDNDNLTAVTSPLNQGLASPQQQQYTYDLLGRRLTSSDPDAGKSSSTYDAVGNVISTTDARNQVISTDYDVLNRPTVRYAGTVTSGPTTANTLVSWAYDSITPLGKGRLTSSTARVNGLDYVQTVAGYTVNGEPTGTTWDIPAGTGVPSAVNYTETYVYDFGGHVIKLNRPAIGGLGAEQVKATWSNVGRPATLNVFQSDGSTAIAQGGTLVDSTTFDNRGRLSNRQFTSTTGPIRTYVYDNLDRVSRIQTGIGTATTSIQDDSYAYNKTDLFRIKEEAGSNAGQAQCFDYDDFRRLAHAYTTFNAGCAGTFFPGGLGSTAYNQSWTFDKDNSITAFNDGTNTITYKIGLATTPEPTPPAHATTQILTNGVWTTNRVYDQSGYLTATTVNDVQALTWDAQRQLVTDTRGGATTNYIYGPEGTRLIRQAAGTTTLTLGGTDIVYNSGTAKARRYYTLGGVSVAMRDNTGTALTKILLTGDTQGSTSIAIDPGNGNAVTRNRYTPYGQPRNAALGALGTGLPTDHGWLGKTLDKDAGLNHLDARYYDATLFTFTAPDSVTEPLNARSANPYTYSYGNPIAFADPSGLVGGCVYIPTSCGGGTDNGGGDPNDDGGSATADGTSTDGRTSGNQTGGTAGAQAEGIESALRRAPCAIFKIGCGATSGVATIEQLTTGRDNGCLGLITDSYACLQRGTTIVANATGVSDLQKCGPGSYMSCADGAFKAVTFVPGGAEVETAARVGVAGGRVAKGAKAVVGAVRSKWLLSRAERIEQHLARLDYSPANDAMLNRLRSAAGDGNPLSSADRAFVRHESTEAWLMDRGVAYPTAHRVAGWTHRAFGNYDPSVIKQFPEYFNNNWKQFWGIE